jgi:hypothetical protein
MAKSDWTCHSGDGFHPRMRMKKTPVTTAIVRDEKMLT